MFANAVKSVAVAAAFTVATLAGSGDAKAWGGRYYDYGYYDYYADPYVVDYYAVAPYVVEEYVYVEPAPVVVYDARPVPWTEEWYDYCASRYRSFDPVSGTFQPYHGYRRLCR